FPVCWLVFLPLAHILTFPRPGLVSLPAAVGLWRGGRLDGGGLLRHPARHDALSALALACLAAHQDLGLMLMGHAPRDLGRRTTRTFPLPPPPQKKRSPPSDSSPDTPVPEGMSIWSMTSPVRGSTRRSSLWSPSQVACQSSPSTQVTPVTNRFDSMVRRIAPVSGSI